MEGMKALNAKSFDATKCKIVVDMVNVWNLICANVTLATRESFAMRRPVSR